MNVNEVEKHVKSEFIVTIILYILTGLTMIVSIFAILITPAKALTDNDISNAIYTGTQHTVTSQPGMAMADASVTNDVYSTVTQNTWTSSVYSIYFQVNTGISANSNVTIRINTSSTLKNLRYTCNSTHVSCTAQYISNNQLNINFATGSSPVTYAGFFISTENSSSFSGIDLFRWTSVRLLTNAISSGGSGGSGSSFDDTGIINNQNQNTTDIINNNNSNTQDIINNQNQNANQTNNSIWESTFSIINQLANRCNNLIDLSKVTADTNATISNVSNTNGTLSVNAPNDQGFWTDYIPIDSSLRYYFNATLTSASSSGYAGYIWYVHYYNANKVEIANYRIYGGQICQNQSACNPLNSAYIRIHVFNFNDGTRNWSNIRLNVNDGAWCPFGSITGNKLDGIEGAIQGGLNVVNDSIEDVKDIQQDTYDYMTDDTNPIVNTSDINNVIGQVQIQDPLNYLLTLPINLLTKLNTLISAGSCSKASFGELYGTELYLPCINFENYLGSSLWGTIDTIVGIGLLVVILKKFYDTISNILSLGKEEEIRKGMELPTPMEFLAQILGGGK